ncbi:MAG: hypothetical protein BRD42_03715 [Bacteroidetes bacterium QS_3_64_15]|nr:MAG: hypothetical protein BRD42_03715 [Bacteroidetes bacterium QS_3_64_15]
MSHHLQHDRETCTAFLKGLLPNTRDALREALAPEGWADSPLSDYAFSAPDEQEERCSSTCTGGSRRPRSETRGRAT